jgi:hypothetical protein
MLVASVVMLCAAWLGTRTVFSLPLDLRANWLFRVMPAPRGAASLPAVRRALLALAVVPILATSAALLLWFWPGTQAAEHLLVLVLLGSVLVDKSLHGFRKIPFTCSYLPGKSNTHLVFWFGILPLIIAIHKATGMEASHGESAELLDDGHDSGGCRVHRALDYQCQRQGERIGHAV